MRVEPTWIALQTIVIVHADQIELFGGASGIRDPGMLESAMARPIHLWHYGEPTIFD
jgi:death-on-curing protein